MTAKPVHPLLLADGYKFSHRPDYPQGTEYVLSTWIARRSYIPGINETVAFGFQRFIQKYLIDYFNDNFFSQDVEELVDEYSRVLTAYFGEAPETDHVRALHALGYLPIRIKAVKEGTLVPIGVPSLTIENTLPEFYWLTNFLETLISNETWMASTSATIAHEFRKLFDKFARITNPEAIDFAALQGHDFSMRGLSGIEAAGEISGLGHLTSFIGTDTVPALLAAEAYYGARLGEEVVGVSVPATEHSVMSAGGYETESETFRRLLTETHPTGILSIVCDTYNLWNAIENILGKDLYDVVMARDGKCVVRPDSGDPADILCGDPKADPESSEGKGVIQLLWEIFGGTFSSTGYKVLDPHVGVIYGDSITMDRALDIFERLEAKGFASTNEVDGIGSFTYQYQTRDTFGTAMKATWVMINGVGLNIFKDPVTDKGKMKKSLTGCVVVVENQGGEIVVIDGLDPADVEAYGEQNLLELVFDDGVMVRTQTFSEIRGLLETARAAA